MHFRRVAVVFAASILAAITQTSRAAVSTYGDIDLLGFGFGGSNPETGTTLEGLAPGASTFSPNIYGHPFPFSPDGADFPGTDQIYVGSVQTTFHDGYSTVAQRINGPQILSLDFSSSVPAGQKVDTLTLGLAADDFQFPAFGQPFIVTLNGAASPALTSILESLNQTGPVEQFFTLGIDPSILAGSNVLTVSIDEGGDGGDGWSVDFATIGVTTSAIPEPASLLLLSLVVPACLWRRRIV